MTRLPLPSVEDAPAASRKSLDAVQTMFGSVPNLFRITANSPATLEAYLGLNAGLSKGELPADTRESIALAIAQINGCDYCLSAHSYIGKNVTKLADAEIAANRNGGFTDPKAEAAVRFAVALVNGRGQVSDSEVGAVKLAGYSDAQIIEIVGHVALNTLTNYLNTAFETPIDFPVVTSGAA